MIKRMQQHRAVVYLVLCTSPFISASLPASSISYSEYQEQTQTAKHCCEIADTNDWKELINDWRELRADWQELGDEWKELRGNWHYAAWRKHIRGDEFDRIMPGRDGRHCPKDPPLATPAPAAIWLLASGLLGILGVARRKPGS